VQVQVEECLRRGMNHHHCHRTLPAQESKPIQKGSQEARDRQAGRPGRAGQAMGHADCANRDQVNS
jgi:hypothetical protein